MRHSNMVTIGAGAAAVRATHGVCFGVITVATKNEHGDVISAEPEIGIVAADNGYKWTMQAVSTCGNSVADAAGDESLDAIVSSAERLVVGRGAKIIVLGCTALSFHIDKIRAKLAPIPVIDPIEEALKSAVQGVALSRQAALFEAK